MVNAETKIRAEISDLDPRPKVIEDRFIDKQRAALIDVHARDIDNRSRRFLGRRLGGGSLLSDFFLAAGAFFAFLDPSFADPEDFRLPELFFFDAPFIFFPLAFGSSSHSKKRSIN